MSTTELWRRAQEVFEEAIDLAPEERRELVERRCGGDRRLREMVDGLLRDDALSRHPLDTDPAAAIAATLAERAAAGWIGKVLANYRLVEILGRGGMGVVYRGRRSDAAFEKEVAVKLLNWGLHSPEARERFRRERQILATIEHDGFARLLDGGTTEEGTPYLVMELVEGVPITEYGRRLPIRDRLRLFLAVCDAVEYAHRRLVVHRDLKATNILVTAEGTPKLLDFGIAKLLESELPRETATELRALTPEYASPEQATGGAITVASDVYSLGVLLFELLTGRRPLRLSGLGPVELVRRLTEEQPPRASATFSGPGPLAAECAEQARNLGLSPRRAARLLRGDLDNILAKCLAKEPRHRYPSVEQLAADLRRHLAGQPVRARPPLWTYRLAKYVRRNAVVLGVGSAAFVALTSFAWITYEQRNRARFEKDRAEAVTRFLVETFEEVDPASSQGRPVTALEVVDRGAARIDDELSDQPQLTATLQATLAEVYSALGRYGTARDLVSQALAAEGDGTDGGSTAVELARLYRLASELDLQLGDYAAALASAERAAHLAAVESRERFRALRARADAIFLQGYRAEALGEYEELLRTLQATLAESDPEWIALLHTLGLRLDAMGREEQAATYLRRALDLQERHHAGDRPLTAELLRSLASLLRKQPGQLGEARRLGEAALSMNERLYGPDNPERVDVLNTVASIARRQGDFEAAVERYQQAIAVAAATIGADNPRVAGLHFNVAALLHEELGEHSLAEPEYREAIRIFEAAVADKNPDHPNLGFLYMGLGDALIDLGKLEESEALLQRALEIWTARGQADKRNGCVAKTRLARAWMRAGLDERAAHYLDPCWQVLRDDSGVDDRDTQRAIALLAEVQRHRGDDQRAAYYESLLTAH